MRKAFNKKAARILFFLSLIVGVFILSLIYSQQSKERKTERSEEEKQVTQQVNPTMKSKINNSMIPRSVIFGNPEYVGAEISPDGLYISYIAPHEGVMNIHTISMKNLAELVKNYPQLSYNSEEKIDNLNEDEKKIRKKWMGEVISHSTIVSHSKKRPVMSYFWTKDSKNICYSIDKDGDENPGMYFVDPQSGQEKFKIVEEGVQVRAILHRKKHPEIILYSTNSRRKDLFDLYQININTWESKLLFKNDKYGEMTVDDDLQLRFGSYSLPDGGIQVDLITSYDATGGVEAKEFMTIPATDVYTTTILGFNKDNSKVYIIDSREHNTPVVYLEDISSRERKELFHDKRSDDIQIFLNPESKELQWIEVNYARIKKHIFDQSIASDLQFLKNFANGREVSISSITLDDRTWIVTIWSDNTPSEYFIYLRDEKKMQFLGATRPTLYDYNLLPMYPVIIKSRDGMDMISYLTLPTDSSAQVEIELEDKIAKTIQTTKPVPLILLVHGGPTARDEWGITPTVQWLANRGYAVLNVNYRGSTGFGKAFINAGNGEWAGKMHDDLIDAVNWAISHSITTKDKVAIMGGSYGGYAALVGLTFTPEVFACGIDIVGPSNLLTLMNSIPPYWEPFINQLKIKIGADHKTEEGQQFLAQRSPITFATNITKPLLIGHGANDPRVKEVESEQIVKELQKHQIPATYVLYPDEGHGFARPENRISFFAITESFLHKCLGENHNFEPLQPEEMERSSAKFIAGKDFIDEKK